MDVLTLVLLVIFMVPLPLLIGFYWSRKDSSSPGSSLLSAFFYGTFFEFALFEILAVPMTFLKCSLFQLSIIWLILSMIFAVFSFYKGILPTLRAKKMSAEDRISEEAGSRSSFSLLLPIVLLCIFLQFFYVTFNQHIDEDDAYYVATATTAVETNTLIEYDPYTGDAYTFIPARYVLAAWPLYLAVLSTLSGGIHPTLIAHMVMPGFILLFTYTIYALIAQDLFPEECKKQHLFLLLVILVLSFSGFSVYSSGTFLFVRAWQGKALVAALSQPAIFYLCHRAMKENGEAVLWFCLFCVVTASCMFSSMGVVLAVIPVGVYTLIYAIPRKQWNYFLRSALTCTSAVACGIAYLIII